MAPALQDTIAGVGIGLRHRHFREIIASRPAIPWFEVHTENFFAPGSAALRLLEEIRAHYPLSAHCVGLSLGSTEPVKEAHLAAVKHFIDRFEPALVSDHLSWGAVQGTHLPDLLPVPYTEEALTILVDNIDQTQNYLGRTILLENPSSYLALASSHIPEQEFYVSVAEYSGCGLLLDINNIYVTCTNQGLDAHAYLAAIPTHLVKEIHLAGYGSTTVGGQEVLVDTHGSPVHDPVWKLFDSVSERFAKVPVLIEWDTEVPELPVLLAEREKAAMRLAHRM